MIRYLAILLFVGMVALTGCGKRDRMLAQQIADMGAAVKSMSAVNFQMTPELAQHIHDTLIDSFDTTRLIIDIPIEDIPAPRVATADWVINSTAAASKSRENNNIDKQQAKEINSFGFNGIIGALFGALIPILTQVFTRIIPIGTPIGGLFGYLNMFMGGPSPKVIKARESVVESLQSYKSKDPNWRQNAVFAHLSEQLDEDDKIEIRRKLK